MRLLRPTLFLIAILAASQARAADVTLAWDPNTETDLAGYKVYFGKSPGSYGVPIVIGKTNTYTITGLVPGTFYFAVTAYNAAGLESGFSNEVSATITSVSNATCDINGDGTVNAVDQQVLVNAILGTGTCPGSCDVNKDSTVNVVDLQVLSNVILGLRSCPQ